MSKHTVSIKYPTGKTSVATMTIGASRMRVKKIVAKDKDTVQWIAPADTDIAIMFPPRQNPAGVRAKLVKAGKKSPIYKIHAPTKSRQVYRYNIFCYATKTYAQGNSEPEMIVP